MYLNLKKVAIIFTMLMILFLSYTFILYLRKFILGLNVQTLLTSCYLVPEILRGG